VKLDHCFLGDCLEVLRGMADNSVDSIVTDPPYGLSFMGKQWDYDVPGVEVWAECLRVLKPGGYLLAFAGTRTQHRMAVRIEDAGFEIRDMIAWVYGQGFPKSLDVSKAIDKRGGNSNLTVQIGAAIKAAREARGLSASECDRTFCGGTTNWSWFEGRPNGQRAPSPETFTKIAEAWPELAHLAEAVAEAEREVVARGSAGLGQGQFNAREVGVGGYGFSVEYDITAPATVAARQWQGFGTALKPALEPITVARKPLIGTVAANVLQHGTGALNIDACRVPTADAADAADYADKCASVVGFDSNRNGAAYGNWQGKREDSASPLGRFPANLIHDGSEEVSAMFPDSAGSGGSVPNVRITGYGGGIGTGQSEYLGGERTQHDAGSGSAARFFYTAKASREDRGADNTHPTVKPTDLMRYLCRLVTPPGGTVLDPFMGSGSTGKAAVLEGFKFVGIEREADYLAIAEARIDAAKVQFAQENAQMGLVFA